MVVQIVIPTVRRLGQEKFKFQDSLGYKVRPHFKYEKQSNNKEEAVGHYWLTNIRIKC
jgi:hypothetical protein